jgi:hypothetical protein
MNAWAFYCYVLGVSRNRRVLACALLNAMGESQQYPVDISEMRKLSAQNRAMLGAFLQWRFLNKDKVLGGTMRQASASILCW